MYVCMYVCMYLTGVIIYMYVYSYEVYKHYTWLYIVRSKFHSLHKKKTIFRSEVKAFEKIPKYQLDYC